MPVYRYQAFDIAGKDRTGELTASSEESAEKQLKRQGFTSIELTEVAPPKAPMPFARKLLIASVVFLFLGSGVFLAVRKAMAPPDMVRTYAEIDEAVKVNDYDGQVQHFQESFAVEKDGRFRKIQRDEWKRSVQKMVEQDGLVLILTTQVDKVVPKDDVCTVVLSQVLFKGRKGTLSSDSETLKVIHIWKRHGFEWKIAVIKERPPAEEN